MNNTINVDEVLRIAERRREISAIDFGQATFTNDAGEVLVISEELRAKWRFTGLTAFLLVELSAANGDLRPAAEAALKASEVKHENNS